MSDIILTIIVLIIISGFLRRLFFSTAIKSFQKATDEFNKRNQQSNVPKDYWSNNTSKSNKNDHNGEYVDYEEVK